MFSYRNVAQEHLDVAKAELVSGDASRLRFAALELRNSFEALVYDRARKFLEEIPPEHRSVWQPRKLMGLLIDIDPHIAMGSSLSIAPVSDESESSKEMKHFGTEVVLTMDDLRRHYDALGSYLHVPTQAQIDSGNLPNLGRLRERCDEIVVVLDRVFASTAWNLIFTQTVSLERCINRDCSAAIHKTFPLGADRLETKCFSCGTEYVVVSDKDGVRWKASTTTLRCADDSCRREKIVPDHLVRYGNHWRCGGCGKRNRFLLCVSVDESAAAA